MSQDKCSPDTLAQTLQLIPSPQQTEPFLQTERTLRLLVYTALSSLAAQRTERWKIKNYWIGLSDVRYANIGIERPSFGSLIGLLECLIEDQRLPALFRDSLDPRPLFDTDLLQHAYNIAADTGMIKNTKFSGFAGLGPLVSIRNTMTHSKNAGPKLDKALTNCCADLVKAINFAAVAPFDGQWVTLEDGSRWKVPVVATDSGPAVVRHIRLDKSKLLMSFDGTHGSATKDQLDLGWFPWIVMGNNPFVRTKAPKPRSDIRNFVNLSQLYPEARGAIDDLLAGQGHCHLVLHCRGESSVVLLHYAASAGPSKNRRIIHISNLLDLVHSELPSPVELAKALLDDLSRKGPLLVLLPDGDLLPQTLHKALQRLVYLRDSLLVITTTANPAAVESQWETGQVRRVVAGAVDTSAVHGKLREQLASRPMTLNELLHKADRLTLDTSITATAILQGLKNSQNTSPILALAVTGHIRMTSDAHKMLRKILQAPADDNYELRLSQSTWQNLWKNHSIELLTEANNVKDHKDGLDEIREIFMLQLSSWPLGQEPSELLLQTALKIFNPVRTIKIFSAVEGHGRKLLGTILLQILEDQEIHSTLWSTLWNSRLYMLGTPQDRWPELLNKELNIIPAELFKEWLDRHVYWHPWMLTEVVQSNKKLQDIIITHLAILCEAELKEKTKDAPFDRPHTGAHLEELLERLVAPWSPELALRLASHFKCNPPAGRRWLFIYRLQHEPTRFMDESPMRHIVAPDLSEHRFQIRDPDGWVDAHVEKDPLLMFDHRWEFLPAGKAIINLYEVKITCYDGIRVPSPLSPWVWPPSIDTFFLLATLRKNPKILEKVKTILDAGTGVGILGQGVAKFLSDRGTSAKVWLWDNQPEALFTAAAAAKDNKNSLSAEIKVVGGHMLADLPFILEQADQLDLIISNPPYLPQAQGGTGVRSNSVDTGLLRDLLVHGPELARKVIFVCSTASQPLLDAALHERTLRGLPSLKITELATKDVPFRVQYDSETTLQLHRSNGIWSRAEHYKDQPYRHHGCWHRIRVLCAESTKFSV